MTKDELEQEITEYIEQNGAEGVKDVLHIVSERICKLRADIEDERIKEFWSEMHSLLTYIWIRIEDKFYDFAIEQKK